MKVRLIITLIFSVLALLFTYHSIVDARRNPFSGILPPSRLKDAPVVSANPIPEEAPAPAYPALHLIVNIPARKVILFDDGQEVARHDIAVGQPVYKTPTGPQEVITIIWNPWWIPPDSPWAHGASKEPPGPKNPLGPVKLLMGQGIRLHGTNKDSSVGLFASHGCLRMHNDEAARLAWYIQKKVNNSADSLFDKYSRNRRQSFWVKLDHPLTVNIVYEPVELRNNIIYIYHDAYRWAKDIKTEILDVLMKNGIDLKKIDAERLTNLEYPKNRYDTVEIRLEDLLSSTPRKMMTYATLN